MIISSIPTEFDVLTQTEEMLFAKALPIINIYLKPGGQIGYFLSFHKSTKNSFRSYKSLPRCPKDLAFITVKVKGQNAKLKKLGW